MNEQEMQKWNSIFTSPIVSIQTVQFGKTQVFPLWYAGEQNIFIPSYISSKIISTVSLIGKATHPDGRAGT